MCVAPSLGNGATPPKGESAAPECVSASLEARITGRLRRIGIRKGSRLAQVIDLDEALGIVRVCVRCAEQGEVGEGKPVRGSR